MPPPRFSNPPPKTESARSAVKAFYCELCQKGYARMNEWEAHEGSYDHQHRKRLKELSRMQRDPNATNKARERERKDEEKSGIGGLSFKPVRLGAGGDVTGSTTAGTGAGAGPLSKGFKKGGFRSAFGGGEAFVDVPIANVVSAADRDVRRAEEDEDIDGEGESESDQDQDMYDPRRPTGCEHGCTARH